MFFFCIELIFFLEQNILMKAVKFITLILLMVSIQQISFSKVLKSNSSEKDEAINQILKINHSFENAQIEENLDENDIKEMGYGINPTEKKTDIIKNYEKTTVELKLAETNAEEIFAERSQKIFKLEAEKYSDLDNIYTENTIWDTSKNFQNIYYQDYKNQIPMPSIINSVSIKRKLDEDTTVYVGQVPLSSFGDSTVDFIRSATTTYDYGTKIFRRGEKLNIGAGTYNSTLQNNISGGAIVSSNPINIPYVKGNFVFGGGFYTNETTKGNRNTGGLFAQYTLDRLKLSAQVAKSKYSVQEGLETGIYVVPELKLTDSLSLKTRFVKNISLNTNQDEIGLAYNPKKNNPRDFKLEVYAVNTYDDKDSSQQRIRFNAQFKL